MVDITVFCNGDQPSAEGDASAGVEFFNAPDHFQKGFLRQIFRKRAVHRGFQKKTGNIIIIQPDQLLKRLLVAALTFFDQGFFIHCFLLLLFFTWLHAEADAQVGIFINIIRVPATISARPTAAFFDSRSLKTSAEKPMDTRMLSLSMGTTTLASPSCSAL